MKVLGLKARDYGAIAAAARAVVKYVQGGAEGLSGPRMGASGYYGGGTDDGGPVVRGQARGLAARLVGLRGAVVGEQLERLLMGRHAVTGSLLLTPRGSAGRFQAHHWQIQAELAAAPDVLTLAQAARFAGVSATYLRRLAENHEIETLAATPEELPQSRDTLKAFRDPEHRRWLVERGELARFMAERQPPTVVIGYDLTCSAPKSVSLLWAFGDETLRNDISAALNAGVDAAIGYLEQHGVVGTVTGRNRAGLGLAAASYQHEISRAEEAHLHIHTIIVNAVPVPLLDDDGRPVLDGRGVARVEWRALDGEVLLRHVKTAGYLGAAALRHELAQRRGLTWGEVRNGVAEIDGFPAELLDAFSTRRGEVTREFTQLVEAGFEADASTLAAAQRGSRAAKRVLSDPQVEQIQRQKLGEAGWTIGRVRQLGAARERDVGTPASAQVLELFDQLTGPNGLTEQQPVFGLREVVQAIAAWAGDRLAPDAVLTLAQRFLADPRIVLLATQRRRRRNQNEESYTTSELLQIEDALAGLCLQGRADHGGPPRGRIDPELAQAGIDAVSRRMRQETSHPDAGEDPDEGHRAGLSEEQANLVRAVLASADLVRPVIGPAGTGKTEAMRAVVHAFTAAGYTVLGTANGGRQAQDLNERLEIPARVVAGWLTLLDHVGDPGDAWPRGSSVLIVDEATQVSTRDAERLLRYATRTGTVVVLVGDPVQLGSVGAGGWFRHLIVTSPEVPGLTVNQRQRGQAMREVRKALTGLRSDVVDAERQALRTLAADGRLALFDSREDMLAAIVTDWYTERHARALRPGPAVGRGAGGDLLAGRSRMMAEHHRDADLLNHAARERLTADGSLTGPVLRAAGWDFQAGDEVITLTQAGHTLVPAGGSRGDYIRTGTIGVVTAVRADAAHPDRQTLTVTFPGRGEVSIDWDYLTHAFPDGRDGGLAHAYAHTAHKAEGSTMDTARAAVPDDTSRSGLYVMLSRARHDLRAYLIRRKDLHADLDDEDWLPVLGASTGPLRALLDNLAESRTERLASEHDPVARAAHKLAVMHSLRELTQMRRNASHDRLLVVRRAEIASETAARHAAIADAAPQLIARIGLRPEDGSQRVVWDQAVGALAVFHARHQPGCPPHELPGEPPDVDDAPERAWQAQRTAAEQLVTDWARQLDERRRTRFHSQEETIPRQRAVVAIHALLAHGWPAARIASALTAEPLDDVRAGAPILHHRAHGLLETAGLEDAAYELLAPATGLQEWQRAQRLLLAVEARHLAGAATGELAAEQRDLTQLLTGTPEERERERERLQRRAAAARTFTLALATRLQDAEQSLDAARVRPGTKRSALDVAERAVRRARQELANGIHADGSIDDQLGAARSDPAALARLRVRLELIDDALAHQIDDAAVRLTQEPAAYLTGLLGQRPDDRAGAATWNRNAVAVEHYRHFVCGLGYGETAAAATSTASASEQALGLRPAGPDSQVLYDKVKSPQPTLDLGAL